MTKKKNDAKTRETIEQTMDQFKKGRLRSGRSNQKISYNNHAVIARAGETRDKSHKAPKN